MESEHKVTNHNSYPIWIQPDQQQQMYDVLLFRASVIKKMLDISVNMAALAFHPMKILAMIIMGTAVT